jgi:hypothetical protein
MKEEYKLTKKELIPIINYWTYFSRQKPTLNEKRAVAVIDRVLGLTIYNASISMGLVLGLEKLIKQF